MTQQLLCDHCLGVIPDYQNAEWAFAFAWWCARCINEHGKILVQFGLSDPGKSGGPLHWASDSDKLRVVPKYDNIVL